jgi:hypothetical protein
VVLAFLREWIQFVSGPPASFPGFGGVVAVFQPAKAFDVVAIEGRVVPPDMHFADHGETPAGESLRKMRRFGIVAERN